MSAFSNWLVSVGDFAVHTILPAAVILIIGILLVQIILQMLAKMLNKSKLERAALGLIKGVASVILYGLLALMVASKIGIDVTGIVALASVLTLAISLAVQNALTNVISGFTLLSTKPFTSGDYVEIAGQSGTVQEIGLTYTKLFTPDNKRVSIPNSAVTSAQIINYTVLGTRRVDVTVSASYTTPVELVLQTLRKAGKVSTVLADEPVFAAVSSYDESAIRYVLRVWCEAEHYWDTLYAVNENIKKLFDQAGVAMTYPHLNVHLDPPVNIENRVEPAKVVVEPAKVVVEPAPVVITPAAEFAGEPAGEPAEQEPKPKRTRKKKEAAPEPAAEPAAEPAPAPAPEVAPKPKRTRKKKEE